MKESGKEKKLLFSIFSLLVFVQTLVWASLPSSTNDLTEPPREITPQKNHLIIKIPLKLGTPLTNLPTKVSIINSQSELIANGLIHLIEKSEFDTDIFHFEVETHLASKLLTHKSELFALPFFHSTKQHNKKGKNYEIKI